MKRVLCVFLSLFAVLAALALAVYLIFYRGPGNLQEPTALRANLVQGEIMLSQSLNGRQEVVLLQNGIPVLAAWGEGYVTCEFSLPGEDFADLPKGLSHEEIWMHVRDYIGAHKEQIKKYYKVFWGKNAYIFTF